MRISKKHLFSFLFLLFMAFSVILPASIVRADESLLEGQVGISDIETVYGKKEPQDLRLVVARIIMVALGFLSVIFLGLVLFAGFKWMTSGGNEESIKGAKKLLMNAVVGLIIVLAAWTITRYVIVIFNKTIVNQSVDYTFY